MRQLQRPEAKDHRASEDLGNYAQARAPLIAGRGYAGTHRRRDAWQQMMDCESFRRSYAAPEAEPPVPGGLSTEV